MTDITERLVRGDKLADAVREYLGEYDTPAKDYAYRAHCREQLRKALAAYRQERPKP